MESRAIVEELQIMGFKSSCNLVLSFFFSCFWVMLKICLEIISLHAQAMVCLLGEYACFCADSLASPFVWIWTFSEQYRPWSSFSCLCLGAYILHNVGLSLVQILVLFGSLHIAFPHASIFSCS
ncbi:hypothetical protein ACOSP7_001723 [Xanthoceras sorbifolium]